MKVTEYTPRPAIDMADEIEVAKHALESARRAVIDAERALIELHEKQWSIKPGDMVRCEFGECKVLKVDWSFGTPWVKVALKTKRGEWSKTGRNVRSKWAHL